jgi:hypothetical protein
MVWSETIVDFPSLAAPSASKFGERVGANDGDTYDKRIYLSEQVCLYTSKFG